MRSLFFIILIHVLCMKAWGKGDHFIVSKITDHYKQSTNGQMILDESTYLVGYFQMDKNNLASGVTTNAKTVKPTESHPQTNATKLDEIIKMAQQISPQDWKNADKKITEEICEIQSSKKTCHSSIELTY